MATHFVRVLNERESLVKAMKMVPVECVVRNVCAGSMAKRYGIEEGTRLPEPIFEFFLKSDALHDPLCNDDHIRVLGWASADEIAQMKAMTHKVNAVLKPLFADAGIDLVDYKLEFGHPIDDPNGAAGAGRRVHAGRLPAVGREDAARSSTRTASAATWARSSSTTAKWRGGSARRSDRPTIRWARLRSPQKAPLFTSSWIAVALAVCAIACAGAWLAADAPVPTDDRAVRG